MKTQSLPEAVAYIGALVPNAVAIVPHEIFPDWILALDHDDQHMLVEVSARAGIVLAVFLVTCARSLTPLGYVFQIMNPPRLHDDTPEYFAARLEEAVKMFPIKS